LISQDTITDVPIPVIHKRLCEGSLSYSELIGIVSKSIELHEKSIRAFLTLTIEDARQEAERRDKKKLKPTTSLSGIPISVKDSLTTKDIRTTAASKILDSFIPPYDATSCARLKEQGTIIVGKTNMDEFAHGFTTEYSAFHETRNPWHTRMAPGGSSGGAAASVATRECLLALATENFGSIIQPASLCGVVGMKPTYGRSSRYGIIAMTSSLECPGIVGRCVEDVAIGIDAISGFDPLDATSVSKTKPSFYKNLSRDISGMKIALIKPIMEKIDNDIVKVIESTTDIFKQLGAEIEVRSWYDLTVDADIYDILYRAEVSSNLARYDGIRFGHSGDRSKTLDFFYKTSRNVFGKHVKRQITTDPITLGEGTDNIYTDALRQRRKNRDYIDRIFKEVDAIITPATAFTSLEIGQIHDQTWRENNRHLSQITSAMVCPTVLFGYPSISFPIGFINNMPIGLNMYAKRFNEQALFNLGFSFQEESGLKCLKPNLKP